MTHVHLNRTWEFGFDGSALKQREGACIVRRSIVRDAPMRGAKRTLGSRVLCPRDSRGVPVGSRSGACASAYPCVCA